MVPRQATAGSVVVVGSANVDLSVRVERLPGPGETVTGGVFERQNGGKGANQAVAAARAGARVRLVAALGDDELGRGVVAGLRRGGVSVEGVSRLAGVSTGVALIVVDADGENQIAVASGANAALNGAAVAAALGGWRPAPGGVCLIGFEVGDEAVLAAARWAADLGLATIVNPAPARRLPSGLAALGPILTPNRREAEELTGAADPAEAADRLRRQTGAPVLVTLGADGALIADDEGLTPMPAMPVHVVDATGAGDALNGILAAELARSAPLREAARWAIAGAALSTRLAGAQAGLPTREEIASALDARSGGGATTRFAAG